VDHVGERRADVRHADLVRQLAGMVQPGAVGEVALEPRAERLHVEPAVAEQWAQVEARHHVRRRRPRQRRMGARGTLLDVAREGLYRRRRGGP